jgi:dihydrofolate reductase
MILSFMKFEVEGDVIFPEFKSDNWEKVSTEDREQFKIVKYFRKHGKKN